MDTSSRLHAEDVRQYLEHFGFEPTPENVKRVLKHETLGLEVTIRTVLDGSIGPEWEKAAGEELSGWISEEASP